jgi:carbon-monoxide dehydrogenase medium subunit
VYKFDFVAVRSPEEAVARLAERGPDGRPIAGGTDLLVQTRARLITPAYVVDLGNIAELARLAQEPDGAIWIGATARMRAIQLSPLFRGAYRVIAEGAGLVGSIQIRNLATAGGNLCNAAPSADLAPPLLAVGAVAEILGPGGRRAVPLEDFFLGPRRTVLAPAEILLGVRVPRLPPRTGGHYARHTPRREMDIAVVGVAAVVTLDNGHCADARIALGAVAPTPIRAARAEAVLRGQPLSAEVIAEAARLAAEDARPISDVRGSADFRRHLVRVLTRRTLEQAWRNAQEGGMIP